MLRDIRKNYQNFVLEEQHLTSSPMELFARWLKNAIENSEEEPTAMTLSTCIKGQPDSRIVLLKEVDDFSFVFFSNYLSIKGKQLAENNLVALNFFWPKTERQVRVWGAAERLNEQQSALYFQSRPRDSQIGAWASPQSREISTREELDQNFTYYSELFKDKSISKPTNWGGYAVKPTEIEFWQGRPNRLHDRFRYYFRENCWQVKRLAP
ncbi:MAG: pyridoxamine 5'-phosphate oxidase [Mangrovibacterium sp.]